MKVLVINCGSSSLKYQLIDMDGEKVLCKGLCERIGMESSMITHEANGHKATTPAIFPTHTEAFAEVVKKMTTGEGKCINDVSEIDAIGHRVVHGGEKFKESCLITDEVIETIRELSPLAPLHNPAGILGIEAARKVFGNIPMVAVFDTAFHSTMPPRAYMYAIPYEYYEKYGVRRYGFHGTSHKYVAHKAAEYLEEPIERLKLITCHLGNGSSIAAVDQGKVVDTSMGMTPPAKPALAASRRSDGGQSTASNPPRPVDSPARVVSTMGESCIGTPPFMVYKGMRRRGRGMTGARGVLLQESMIYLT